MSGAGFNMARSEFRWSKIVGLILFEFLVGTPENRKETQGRYPQPVPLLARSGSHSGAYLGNCCSWCYQVCVVHLAFAGPCTGPESTHFTPLSSSVGGLHPSELDLDGEVLA